ncbi:MAG TPA: AsmA family protein [Burkholderiales bacterium]
MRKPLKYGLLGLGGLLVLAIGGVAVFAMTFDPNKYKGQIAAAVKEKTGRTLKLGGDLQVAIWPSLGAKVAGVTLSEKDGTTEFLSLESAQVSVAVMPLLRGAAVVDGVRVSGLKANVVKDKQGKFNFDDLLEGDAKKPAPKPEEKSGGGGAPVAFDIGSVKVERSAVSYRDLGTGREIAISGFEFSTGRVAEQASGKLKLAAQAKARNPDLDAKVDLGADYKLDMPAKRYDLSNLDLKVSGSGAGKKNLALAVAGALSADLAKESVAGDLSTKFDESTIKAKFGLVKFAAPAYTFDVDIDKLNLDRYMPAEEKPAAKEPSKPAPAGKQAETPVDLSALKGLNANGKLHVGALQVRGLKLADVRADVKAANGRADIAPHSANLYEGKVAGALSLNADGNRITLKEDLTGIAIGPLLRDVAQKDMLEGKGNIALDVNAAGPTVEAMKKALAGTARVQLKDGAYKGFNLGEALRKAKAALGGSREEKAAAAETKQTDFSEMSASFAIKNGVAHNEDLDVKAPLFRVAGKGDVDIGNSRLDYTTKATVVGTSKGQGGAELEQLSGLTVPVRLSGPFDAIKYDVQYGAVASDLAKSKAGGQVKEQLEKNRDKIEDRLKGLLGR